MADILVPIAISSQLDDTGEERIHAAQFIPTIRVPYTPPVIPTPHVWLATDNTLVLIESSDGGLTFPASVATGLPTPTSEVCVQSGGGRIFHFGVSNQGRTSTDGVNFVACNGITSTAGVQPGTGNLIYINGEYQLYHSNLSVSVDGVNFVDRPVTSGAHKPVVNGNVVLATLGGRFLQVSSDYGTTFVSYNASANFHGTEGIQRLLVVPTGYLAFGRDLSGNLLIGTSTTGLSGSWTTAAGPATPICHGVARDPDTGRILMVLQNGTTWYSDNEGVSWLAGATITGTTLLSFPPAATNNMLFVDGAFLFAARHGGGVNAVHRTPNGIDPWVISYSNATSNAIDSMAVFTP